MEKYLFLFAIIPLLLSVISESEAGSSTLHYKDEFLRGLIADVPKILQTQDPKTGRFGTGIWIVNDQHAIYPLAVAWATESKDNPYYHDPKVLEAIMAGGDALIEDADENGQWEFRKKDGSTWGQIYMPWTYSRWLRAYGLIRDGMPADRRKRWEDALAHGYTGIAAKELTRPVNIPAHHAMGLYIAGKLFNRPEWCEQAQAFMAKVAAAQDPGGYWTEHYGPVVMYNFVYMDALGVYYGASKDKTVLPALERAARFHSAFLYPNGAKVETIDERNPYQSNIAFGNVGFSFTPEGRGYLAQQLALLKSKNRGVDADLSASFILYGDEGSTLPTAAEDRDHRFVSGDKKSLIRRKGDWFICLSAYCCPVLESRWIQDRQNFVSVYNDHCGLILGGGSTKLQPLWSNFTVGDTSLLVHKPGDTKPKFTPPPGIIHVPSASYLEQSDPPGLMLEYGEEKCEIQTDPIDDTTMRIKLRATTKSGMPVAAHLALLPHMGKPFATEKTPAQELGKDTVNMTSEQIGGWIEHGGWRLTVPQGVALVWPVLPHNPYTADGHAEPGEGRIVVTIPFSAEKQEYELMLKVEK